MQSRNLNLKKQYKQQELSDLQNAEYTYYNNELKINKNYVLKKLENADTFHSKMSFSIDDAIVQISLIMANEFNNVFVSIASNLSSDVKNYVNSVVNCIVYPDNHSTRSEEYYLIY